MFLELKVDYRHETEAFKELKLLRTSSCYVIGINLNKY